MAESPIEWTGFTWNPVTGCTKVSAGCEHCYIERTPPFRLQHRAFAGPHGPGAIGATTGVQLHPERLAQPLTWRTARRIFVCSLADLFHHLVPDDFIASVFAAVVLAERHTFQILTKRPARMRALMSSGEFHSEVFRTVNAFRPGHFTWPPPNAWLGTSVEDEKAARLRIPQLLETPAAVRFLSCEPLLGPLSLGDWLAEDAMCDDCYEMGCSGDCGRRCSCHNRIDWVIAGGESGPGARPMHPDWARSLRDQCVVADVPFFFKQWGEWSPIGRLYGDDDQQLEEAEEAIMDAVGLEVIDGRQVIELERDGTIVEGYQATDARTWLMAREGKKRAGRELDGRTWDEFPGARLALVGQNGGSAT